MNIFIRIFNHPLLPFQLIFIKGIQPMTNMITGYQNKADPPNLGIPTTYAHP